MLFIDRDLGIIANHEWRVAAVLSAYWALSSAQYATNEPVVPALKASRGLRKSGCKAVLRIAQNPSGRWVVRTRHCEHNHAARHVAVDPLSVADLLEMRAQVQSDNTSIESVLLQRERHGHTYDKKKLMYYINSEQDRIRIGGGDTQAFIDATTADVDTVAIYHMKYHVRKTQGCGGSKGRGRPPKCLSVGTARMVLASPLGSTSVYRFPGAVLTTGTIESVAISGWLRGEPGATAPAGCVLYEGAGSISTAISGTLILEQATFATRNQLARGARCVTTPRTVQLP